MNADLLDAESIDKALIGATYVVHTASPFPIEGPKNEDELIKPAVEGTLAVMRAAHKHKVKRVVITSSVAAIFEGHPENATPESFNENHWSIEANLTQRTDFYSKSKTMAEKAAWDF